MMRLIKLQSSILFQQTKILLQTIKSAFKIPIHLDIQVELKSFWIWIERKKLRIIKHECSDVLIIPYGIKIPNVHWYEELNKSVNWI